MSHIDLDFPKGDEVQVDAAEILDAVEAQRSRTDAVVRYFSAAEGWEEASAELRGAFAAPEVKK